MNFIKDNNISKYNYDIHYYVKLSITKFVKQDEFNIINNECIKGKLFKYDNNIINDLNNYCKENKFIEEKQQYILNKVYNKYKYIINDNTNEYYKKELLNGKIFDDNLLYTEIYTPINFYEFPNKIYDNKIKKRTIFFKEYIEIEKDILDNKLIENPKLTIDINEDNYINIDLNIFNYKNNYIINDIILYDLMNILKILNINISKDNILNYIDDVKKICL